MNHRFTAVSGSIGRARGALLAVLVLNAVVVPCAMAVGLDDSKCLHALSGVQHETAGHHEMPAQHDMAGHQGHHDWAESAEHGCADAQCCVVEAASVDSRSGQQKVRDAGDWDAAPVAHVAVPIGCRAMSTEPVERPPDQPGASPPRHKLFCVYLD